MTEADNPGIDGPALFDMVDGDRSLVAQLFDMFLSDTPGRIARMRAAVGSADATVLKSEAHSVKGSAANLRVIGIAAVAEQIEVAATHNDFSAAAAALARLDLMLAKMPAAVARVLDAS
jgi:HPt (histidine-containing phosphotransfer) domain-containing protein